MTDQERMKMAFDILDNCRVHDVDGSLVLLAVDHKLWEKFLGIENSGGDE